MSVTESGQLPSINLPDPVSLPNKDHQQPENGCHSTESSKPTVSLPKYLLVEGLTQECKQILPSLPTEKGWVANSLHQYQGFWHTTRQLQGVLTCQSHFQAEDTDILLVTTPKSGTTWLKAIVFCLMNRFQYPNYPAQTETHPLLAENPHVLVPFLECGLYIDGQVPNLTTSQHKPPSILPSKSGVLEYGLYIDGQVTDLPKSRFEPGSMLPPRLRMDASPRIFGSHLPFVSLPDSVKSSTCKLVYLCRNPKDTFVSLWHFTNKLRSNYKGENSLEETLDKFCRGVSLYGPFWDHVLEYWNQSLKNPERVLFLKYEEMKEQPKSQLVRLARFLGCPFSSEEESSGAVEDILKLCSFDNLSNLEVNKNGKLASGEEYKAFFRRGEVGDAKNHLTPEMMEKLDKITEEKLHGSGLTF